jgi:hypothetical protein
MTLPLNIVSSTPARQELNFGGLPLEFITPVQENQDQVMLLSKLTWNLPIRFVASLVRETYSKGTAFQQSVIDALSPFQLASKLWASNAVRYITITRSKPISCIYYFGAWFSLQGALDRLIVGEGFKQPKKIYIDLDATSLMVGQGAHVDNGTAANSNWQCQNVWSLDPLILEPNSLVIWTGIEHFDPVKIKQLIEYASSNITWLLQGTNMPADDHTNLVHSVEDLSKYFNTEPLLQGEMKTPIGSRFMAVF